MANKMKVCLIYGGKSGEHEVSLQTAFAVSKALNYEKYEVHPIYITVQGEWKRGEKLIAPAEDIKLLKLDNETVLEASETSALTPLWQSENGLGFDVVLPLLHGTFGEDGTIQGLLEMANVPYVGAGVMASAVGMDKVMMKKVFAQEGLPQCEFTYFTKKVWEAEQRRCVAEIEERLGYPCFVKPANLGSSVGISKAADRDELIAAVDYAFNYDRKVIVEEHVEGREIEIGVLGNEEPAVSVPGEVISSSEFYDYNAKYIDGNSAMVIPPENFPEEKVAELQQLAIRAFRALDATGLSRVDFFLRQSDDALLINEINTMPGFTPYSMYPLLWLETGKTYEQLIDELIALALERYNEKQRIQFGFHL